MKVNLISWNVRGLNDERKRRMIKSCINTWKADVYCFQETKVEGDISDFVRDLWANRWVDHIQLEASGTRGGILLMWDKRIWDGERSSLANQGCHSIACKFTGKMQDLTCYLIRVYAPNDRKTREEVWEEIGAARGLFLGPWKKGSRHDVAASLDRFFISDEWDERFRNIKQLILDRVTSDQSPVLLQPDFILAYKLKDLNAKLRNWSKTLQGNLEMQKLDTLSQLSKLEEIQDLRNLTEEEIRNKIALTMDFEEIEKKEEMAWRQRSRELWLKQGDNSISSFIKQLMHTEDSTISTC
ncbi:uncharacterized protein LOC124896275 [Capsicum annuum]|uniref:uncharacterized protein LOC124896275 n=1 Tax=Capsicum annuum TaxID=4072 RepID=UPI001FB0BD84|nr:uncharacterized protein LOC124896275 [Capsicum annuum]